MHIRTFQDQEVHAAAEELHVEQPCAAEKWFAFQSFLPDNTKQMELQTKTKHTTQ
jgi:hypothetical protein